MSKQLWRTSLKTLRKQFKKAALSYPGTKLLLMHAGPTERNYLETLPKGYAPDRWQNAWYFRFGIFDESARQSARRLHIRGTDEAINLFYRLAKAAGELLRDLPPDAVAGVSSDSLAVDMPAMRWLSVVFDLAWSAPKGSLWRADRTHLSPSLLGAFSGQRCDAFFSELTDAFLGSVSATDIMLTMTGGTPRDQGGAGQAEGSDAKVPPTDEWIWAPDGNGYLVAGLGERGHFAKLKGLAMIQMLVRTPGQPVPMALLVGDTGGQLGKDKRSKQPAMDAEALRDAHTQCSILRADLEQAEADGRTLEAQELRAKLESLQQKIRSALGVKGKVRDLNDVANKLRPLIHAALSRIYKAMRGATPALPKLADHLELTIGSEGAAYVYRPAMNVAWKTTIPVKK